MSCGPQMPPCTPPTPEPCPQYCEPPAPPPCARPKPIMRGLGMAQYKRTLVQALGLSLLGGLSVYFFIGRPRMAAYKKFHETAEYEAWADEMARKGLFQTAEIEEWAEEMAKKGVFQSVPK